MIENTKKSKKPTKNKKTKKKEENQRKITCKHYEYLYRKVQMTC